MPGYRRFIAYVYAYDQGKKGDGKPSARAVAELHVERDGKIRLGQKGVAGTDHPLRIALKASGGGSAKGRRAEFGDAFVGKVFGKDGMRIAAQVQPREIVRKPPQSVVQMKVPRTEKRALFRRLHR